MASIPCLATWEGCFWLLISRMHICKWKISLPRLYIWFNGWDVVSLQLYTRRRDQKQIAERIDGSHSHLISFSFKVASDWPCQGHIEFQQVVLAYRPELPNALDGLTFTVYSGEKVGIVGRTGSGKSTLFLALFRMVELKAGRILLDNIDSHSVSLKELR